MSVIAATLALTPAPVIGATTPRILLPLIPLRGVELGPPVPCGQLTAVRCVWVEDRIEELGG